MTSTSLQRIPPEERPRERLMHLGSEALSAAELVAIILSSGTKGKSVLQLAQELLAHFGGLQQLAGASIEELCQIKGLGKAKAIQLQAAFAIGLKLARQPIPCRYRIDSPRHAYQLIKDELEHEKRERLVAILQDAKGYVIGYETVSLGTLTQTLVHPREVFYPAIRHKAAAIIVAHNHPSGDPTPSQEDFTVTRQLLQAARVLNIALNDHLVIGNQRFVSIREEFNQHGELFA